MCNLSTLVSEKQGHRQQKSQATEVKTQWTTSSDVVGDRKNPKPKGSRTGVKSTMVQQEGRGILKCPACCKPTKWPNTREGCILSENCCEQIWEQRIKWGSWEREKHLYTANYISINGMACKQRHLWIDLSTQIVYFNTSPGFLREMADSRSGAGRRQGELEIACLSESKEMIRD